MSDSSTSSRSESSTKNLNEMIVRLKSTPDPRRRYEYILWLAKGLPALPEDLLTSANQVKGCISQVYVSGELIEGKINWKGYSDALITKGLLAFLIKGLNELTPQEVLRLNPSFINDTGLNSSLTPSRANGFLNILLKMKQQAQSLSLISSCSNK